MKKLVSILLIGLLLLPCLTLSASATEDELPFELVAPAYVTAEWMGGNDSPTTTKITYSLSNEMTAFFKEAENAHLDDRFAELMSEYGYDDIYITTQVDWAVDDVNDSVSGWHANEFWNADNGFGYDDEGRYRVGEWDGVDLWIGNVTETVNDHWITRYVSEDSLNGNPDAMTPGLKNQMHSDQFEYRYDEDGEGSLWIDYTRHTVYFRMRFVVTTVKDTDEGTVFHYYYSDWSDTASVGKDAVKFEPLTKEDLPAPVITGLRMTDREFNGNPVVAFTLTVPDSLMENATRVEAAGGIIWIETYCRVKGDTEWTEMGNVDHDIKAGEMECALLTLVNDERPSIPRDTDIELRCRYYCDQPGEDEPLYSDYSEIITFGTDDIHQGDHPGTDVEPVDTPPVAPEKKTCPICHFCPQPLGICIFIWLLILLAVIVIIVIVVRRKSKKKEQ